MENNQLFQDGEKTELASENMMSLMATDEEYDRFPPDVKEYIQSFNNANPFYEGIYKAAVRHGFSGSAEDEKSLEKFVSSKCKEAGIKLDLRSWLQKKKHPGPASRQNVYLLCFALGMDALETKEFFLKAYLERPFNYKDLHEAVYFFCMSNHRNYQDACRIIERVDAAKEEHVDAISSATNQNTEYIGGELLLIQDEDSLVEYLAANAEAFANQNVSAIQEIKRLYENCIELAGKQNVIEYNGDKNLEDKAMRSVVGTFDLLWAIYGRPAREYSQADISWNSLSKSDLPKLITESMPVDIQVSNILNGKDASYTSIRKLLILLAFYNFFADPNIAEADGDLYDEFMANTNEILARCGYVQLYMRNPYDWLFLYCAFQNDPLSAFQNIIDCYAGGEQV